MNHPVVTALLPVVLLIVFAGIEYGWAVLKSVRTRAAEIALPRSMGVATKVTPLFPEPVTRFFRRVSGDDAVLNKVDATVRGNYLDRIRPE